MRIKVETKGFRETIKALENAKTIDSGTITQVLEKVANSGVKMAQNRYNIAETDGNDTPSVYSEINGNEARIIASGEGVAFIEFGTGVLNDEHPLQNEVEGIVPHGQYGLGMANNPSGWYYLNSNRQFVHTKGIDAQRCLYDTGKELELEIPKIVKEVVK